MVVKLALINYFCKPWFESSVIPYGSKTRAIPGFFCVEFESSVIPYGSKTAINRAPDHHKFESSVIPYGSKT